MQGGARGVQGMLKGAQLHLWLPLVDCKAACNDKSTVSGAREQAFGSETTAVRSMLLESFAAYAFTPNFRNITNISNSDDWKIDKHIRQSS